MMQINSKWNYMATGLNVAFAFVGAMWHSVALLLMSGFFAIYNYYVAENNRRFEDEQLKQPKTEDKE
jgi:hypothetical protein